MKQSVKILISGGGTGGHIYPAISIANEIKKSFDQVSILFVGAKGKMEMQKVPQKGYDIKGLWISGIQRKLTFKNLLFPLKLVSSLLKAFFIIKKFKPNVVIGTGGFASGPTLIMANWLGIKTLVQEQNSYPGITNKLLSKKANKICVAYEGLERFFPKEKVLLTGNPVRQDLLMVDNKREVAIEFFNLDSTKKTLLVLGGSLGARAINNLISENLNWLIQQNIQLIWQCGTLYFDEFNAKHHFKDCKILAFIDKMDYAFAAADFIISRAGASSVSELCLVGKPTLFIPSPNVAEDHQTQNALAIVKNEAALLLKESEINQFKTKFKQLIDDEELQNKLSKNIKKLGKPNATKSIVEEVKKLLEIE